MTKDDALLLVRKYSRWAYARQLAPIISEICERWPEDGSTSKAMRWLGFCQGWLVSRGHFSLEQVKQHSKDPHGALPVETEK